MSKFWSPINNIERKDALIRLAAVEYVGAWSSSEIPERRYILEVTTHHFSNRFYYSDAATRDADYERLIKALEEQ